MSDEERLVFRLKGQGGYVDGKQFVDSDLSSVAVSTVFLDLECADISDTGINHLPTLDELMCIDLDSTNITDISLKKIGSFSKLEEIWVEDTRITDDGLAHLQKLKNLKFISITDCVISDEAVEKLTLHIPAVEVH